jgi:hypothetical protein
MFASGLAAVAVVLSAVVELGAPLPLPLVAQIAEPPAGSKLRPGDRQVVRIRVSGGAGGSMRWNLSLRRISSDDDVPLATGSGPIEEAAVAELAADDLDAGEAYLLTLEASDGDRSSAATAQVSVIDPAYSLVPMDEGNRWQQLSGSIYGTTASGDVLLVAGPSADPAQLFLINRATGKRQLLHVPVWSTESVRITPDGSRLFFFGWIPPSGSALGFLDVASRTLSVVDDDDVDLLSLDASGRRVAYWAPAPGNTHQYFLYDEAAGMRRQLTEERDIIRRRVAADDCPQILATRPFIGADGSRVVIITKATLGLAPPDEAIGCRVFAYDVEKAEWRQVAALPRSIVVDVPTLSGDGRWLSFRAQGRPPATQPAALLLDVDTGELQDPVLDVGGYVTFDSVITGDGKGIVISTQADLDPRVGNADHNLELFHYDFTSREIRQITETTGGVGSTPGFCESYRPAVSADGGVVVFAFHLLSIEPCRLDGPMRHERDDLVYRFVRAVRRRSGNRGPVLDPIADPHVIAGETLTLSITASDPDGDPLTFFAQVRGGTDVPPGSVMTDHHDGTASFTWPTRPEHAGTTVVRVAAFDEGGGEVFQDVTLTIVAAERSPSVTPSRSPEPTATVTATPVAASCPVDCNGDGQVMINELLTATAIALGTAPLSTCPAAACGSSERVDIACLTQGVAAALSGCAFTR